MKRERLPSERKSVTHAFRLMGKDELDEPTVVRGYIQAGLYDDGRVGEVFVKLDKQGSTISGLIDAWAIAFSMCLQSGYTLRALCDKFRGMKFEPAGITNNPQIRFTVSPVDYVCQWLLERFCKTEENPSS